MTKIDIRITRAEVPMIIGNVNTEGSLFVGLGGGWQNSTTNPTLAQQTMWSMINSGTPTPSDAAIITPAWQQASGQPFSSSAYSQASVYLTNIVVDLIDLVNIYLQDPLYLPPPMYRYHFLWANQPQPWQDIYGTEHAMDVPFVFGNFPKNSFLSYAWTTGNQPDWTDLSNLISSYYGNFMWNGNPNTTNNNPHPYANAPGWISWSNTGIFGIGAGERMMFNASLGKANAGASSASTQSVTLGELAGQTMLDALSVSPVAWPFEISFIGGFIPQPWLNALNLSLPTITDTVTAAYQAGMINSTQYTELGAEVGYNTPITFYYCQSLNGGALPEGWTNHSNCTAIH